MSAISRRRKGGVGSRREGREDAGNLLAFLERQRIPNPDAPIRSQYFVYGTIQSPVGDEARTRDPKLGRPVGSVEVALRDLPGSGAAVEVSAKQVPPLGQACTDSFDHCVRVIAHQARRDDRGIPALTTAASAAADRSRPARA